MRRITGLVYDDQYLRHVPGEWHPERPARLEAIMQRLQDTGLLEEVFLIRPYPAPLPWIERLHDPGYIKRFEETCQKGVAFSESRTAASPRNPMRSRCWRWGGYLPPSRTS